MYHQQGGNIASDCFREKNLSLYSVCTSLGTICTSNKGETLPATALERGIYLFIVQQALYIWCKHCRHCVQ